MFKITEPKHKIKTVRPGDSNWHISTTFTLTPRAGFEISPRCPKEYRMIIRTCIDNGWVQPVAYMKESEYVWEQLGGTA
jgi:hypothetical protein